MHTVNTMSCVVPAGSVAELVAAGLSNLGSLYLTVEGAAKTHMNGFITAKATVLESLLGRQPHTLQTG
jgi:hypothetical protein